LWIFRHKPWLGRDFTPLGDALVPDLALFQLNSSLTTGMSLPSLSRTPSMSFAFFLGRGGIFGMLFCRTLALSPPWANPPGAFDVSLHPEHYFPPPSGLVPLVFGRGIRLDYSQINKSSAHRKQELVCSGPSIA